jgi:hypothetical protein
VGAFEEARQGALLKPVAALLAVMRSINDFFDRMDALEVPRHTYLCKEIHCLLEAWKLALAFRGRALGKGLMHYICTDLYQKLCIIP